MIPICLRHTVDSQICMDMWTQATCLVDSGILFRGILQGRMMSNERIIYQYILTIAGILSKLHAISKVAI